MSTSGQPDIRSINIRFEAYGEDDPEFKADLIVLMIDNLNELQLAAKSSHDQNDSKIFSTALHKTKSTINLIDDSDLFVNIESARDALSGDSGNALEKVESFRIFVDVLIRSLAYEVERLRRQTN